MPVLFVTDSDVLGQGVVAVDFHDGHAERLHPVGRHHLTAGADALFVVAVYLKKTAKTVIRAGLKKVNYACLKAE